VSAERIAAAVEPLRAFAPGPYPPGVTGPMLQPLLVMPDALSLQLVTGDATPSAAGAVLSLRTGVIGQLTLTLSEFQAAYNALFAGLALLTGNVVVNLGGAIDTETVPIALRAGTTWGPALDEADQPVDGASVQVTLTNAPVRVNAATGFLWRDGPGQPTEITVPVSGAPAGPLFAPAQVSADGHLGPKTTTALQQGLAANGWYPASAVNGVFDADTAVGIQQWIGVAADGDVGPQTIRALQGKVGATVNGVWESVSRPHTANPDVFSRTTQALQVALNAGILPARVLTSPLTLPATLTAGGHLVLTAATSAELPGAGTLRGRVDASFTVLADPQAVWDSVFSHSVPSLTTRTVTVRVVSDIFAARTSPSPRPALKAVTVTFGTGIVVSFDVSDVPAAGTSPFIIKQATLPVSLRDYVLAAGGARPYTYRVSALTVDDQTVADAMDRTDTADHLDISLPAFPAPS